MKLELPFCPTCGKRIGKLEVFVHSTTEPDCSDNLSDIYIRLDRVCNCKTEIRFTIKEFTEDQPK